MNVRGLLLAAMLAALLAACTLPFGRTDQPGAAAPAAPPLLREFFQPESVERHLTAMLTDSLRLEGVQVDYQGQTIRAAFEMPDGLSTGQSMLLFTTLLDAAARYAPFSQTVELAVLVGGEPFYTLITDTQSIVDHRSGKISVSELVRAARLEVPAAGEKPAATGPLPAATEAPRIDGAELIANIPVLASALHADPYGNWSLIGAVGNNNDVVVSEVQLAYRVADAAGTIMYEGVERVSQSRIAPGKGCAFSIHIPWSEDPPASYELTVDQATYDPDEQDFPILEMVGTRILPGEDGQSAVIVGLLRNPYPRTVILGALTGLGVDQAGLPLSAAAYGTSRWSLAAQSSSPFSIVLEGMSPEELAALNNVILFSDGWFTSPTPPATLQISQETRYFRATDGSSHILGFARTTGDRAVSGRLIGVLYDAQGAVLDVASGYLPGDPLPPGFQVAFDISDFRSKSSLIAEQATRFEVIVDMTNLSETYSVEAVPLGAGITLVEPQPSMVHVEAMLAPFASGYDEVICWVNAWSPDRKTLLGTLSAGFDPLQTQGGTIDQYLDVDPKLYDQASVVAEVVVFGFRRSD